MVCNCHTVTFRPDICVKMFVFNVQSDPLETKCLWVKVSQGKNVTVDISRGSKCHSGRNVGGRNVKAREENGSVIRVNSIATLSGNFAGCHSDVYKSTTLLLATFKSCLLSAHLICVYGLSPQPDLPFRSRHVRARKPTFV
jgi:hypothetical protein